MNEDAEKWIAKTLSEYPDKRGHPVIRHAMMEGMRWAYADAARICRQQADGYWYGDGASSADSCASQIEERAK